MGEDRTRRPVSDMCSRTDTQTDSIDTTTVEKLEGTSSEEDVNSFLFLLGPFPVSRYCATNVLPIPFPTPLYSPRKFSKRVWFASHIAQRKKRKPVAKIGVDQIRMVPVISKVGGDASHGYHGVIAPMTDRHARHNTPHLSMPLRQL